MKIFKYTVSVLILFAVLQEINIIRILYAFFDMHRQAVPIPVNLFLVIFLGSILAPLIYIIFYLISIILIIKNKKIGYLFTGIDSLLIFEGSIKDAVESNIPVNFSFTIVMIFMFWVSIITLSFVAYFKMIKQGKNIVKAPYKSENDTTDLPRIA